LVDAGVSTIRTVAAAKIYNLTELAILEENYNNHFISDRFLSPSMKLFDSLLNILPTLRTTTNKECQDYFQLLICIVERFGSKLQIDITLLVVTLCEFMEARLTLESAAAAAAQCDMVLVGSLNVLCTVLRLFLLHPDKQSESIYLSILNIWDSKQLLKLFFSDLLHINLLDSGSILSGSSIALVNNNIHSKRCGNFASRRAVFDVIFNFCKISPTISKSVFEYISPIHELKNLQFSSDGTTKYNSLSYYSVKSPTGYCGLINPGCICYMISCLQQFYMVPSFRQAILKLNFNNSTSSTASGFKDDSDSFLFQLYKMFAYLQESVLYAYDLSDFCNAFKDFEGNPINIALQQDASEFITNFFQQLENDTIGTLHENILKETFGGTFSNELLAEGGNLLFFYLCFFNLLTYLIN
jgi:hypothetical protein